MLCGVWRNIDGFLKPSMCHVEYLNGPFVLPNTRWATWL